MRSLLPVVRVEVDAANNVPSSFSSHKFGRSEELVRQTIGGGLMLCTVLALTSLFVFGSACVGPAAQRSRYGALDSVSQNSSKSDDVVCEYERPTGSNVPKRVCRSLRDTESDRQEIQDALRRTPKSEPWSKD